MRMNGGGNAHPRGPVALDVLSKEMKVIILLVFSSGSGGP